MKNSKQIKFKDWICEVQIRQYKNDRVALELIDAEDGMSVATASVNIPEASLKDDEILIKSWSENEGMTNVLIKAGIIGPAIGQVPTGFVHATKHKLLGLPEKTN
jgi:hypothetical protein